MPRFSTARLELRGLRPGDEAFLAALDCDPAVMRHIPGWVLSPAVALENARAQIRVAAYRTRAGRWLAVARATGTPVGWVELARLGEGLQIGYAIAPAHAGRGYATEAAARILEYAFQRLRAERVSAVVRPENAASVRVLEKLEFRRVGQRRDDSGAICGEYSAVPPRHC